ncbi:cucurbitadienol 11-hydroxylase-like isoform X1 [Mercurialis annua]|uniref:cucurbitadienol 11-hydroxylase-like isoform X1 n=1 Tax=Mercurialis annua TaxID=3986 RepID=UPI002160583A|nr:cucurbitadienol 11-hydroxylase-like isoform X1 [Mercurialis annua]
MLTFVLFFVALFGLYYTIWINKWRNLNCEGVLPPGSMGFPFIGETLQLLIPSYSLDTHPFIKKRVQRYGPIFRSNIACRPIVISTDPEFNKHIINQEGRLVEMWYFETFSKILVLDGESRTNISGYIHKYIRGAFLGQLGAERLKMKMLPLIENMVTETLHSWSNQDVVHVKNAISITICDATAKVLCGYEAIVSANNLSESFSLFAASLMAFPLNIPGSTYRKCIKHKENVMNVLRGWMIKRRQTSSVEKPAEDEDFFDVALKEMEKDKFFTEEFILNLLFSFLFASFTTISATISLMLKFVSSHPEVLQQLMAEHDNILKNRRPDCSITWEEYKSMTYTQQVINESLRMTNIAPGLLRKAVKDIQYKGYTIPAGWSVMVVDTDRHMDSKVYKDPLVFNPSRWKELDSYTISKNFSPFGGGTRQCVGADYSRVVMSIFFHVLVTKYRWTKVKEGKLVRNPILGFGEGLHVKLFEKN